MSSTDAISFFKGYYMVTSRCNLDCGYCVLEDAPHQLRRELDLDGKKSLISHLYHRLGYRRLTLSGGEVLMIGKRPPTDFLEIVEFMRTFRSSDPRRNLEVELYTNGVLLDDQVADALCGVVDLVAITIDSRDNELLTQIGRNVGRYRRYFERAVGVCGRLTKRGIAVKLHSVIGTLNYERIGDEVRDIADDVLTRGGRIEKWKFYQYMSYDDPVRDGAHAISPDKYARAMDRIASALADVGIPLHFKDNGEMNESLFNILPYGNAQYMRAGDTWSTTRRTRDLREYHSIQDLLANHDIDENAFRKYHQISRTNEGSS